MTSICISYIYTYMYIYYIIQGTPVYVQSKRICTNSRALEPMYMQQCIYTHTHTYTHTHVHTHTHTHTHTRTHAFQGTPAQPSAAAKSGPVGGAAVPSAGLAGGVCVCARACVYYAHSLTHTCMHTYLHVYIHTYIHT